MLLASLSCRRLAASMPFAFLLVSLAVTRADAQQRRLPIENVKRWQLTFDLERSQKTQYKMTATSPSGPVTVTGERSYSVTCSGSAVLNSLGGGGFSGPIKANCNYTSAGSANSPISRGTMSGRGVPDPSAREATLALDPGRGEYHFGVGLPTWTVEETTSGSNCQMPAVITPTSKCVWVPFTQVTSEPASIGSVGFDQLPLPRGVTTLSGTNNNPPDDDPSATQRVSWSITPAGAVQQDSVVVSIEGPACACLDAEKVPGSHVKWSATASKGGGTFGPFTVQSAGPAPKIVSNSGGAAVARITLESTQATQAVTLTATYTHKGRAVTATRDVEFCVFDSISIGDGSRNMSFEDANPGNLRVQAKSRALHNSVDVSAELAWIFEPIGSASTTTMAPANPTGGVADVTYTGLPEFNAAFGPKRIEVSLDKGACACKRADSFRAFYSPTATNHPPSVSGIGQGTALVPNWFYYYSQTPAIAGVPGVLYAPKLFSSRDNQAAIAQFNETDGNIYLSDLLWQIPCRPSVPQGGKPVAPSGAGNDGIDCVAETTRHEAQHRADWATWWPNGYLIVADPDLDAVPLLVEVARPGCSSVSKTSCDERPFTDVGDREINAYWVGWRWRTGSINTQDWACGPKGKQWKAGYRCPEDP